MALQCLAVFGIEFVTVTVTLRNLFFAVNLVSERAFLDFSRPGAKAHGSAFVRHVFLLLEHRNHRVRRIRVELRTVRSLETADMTRKLNRRNLHSQTQTQKRSTGFARETDSFDFPLDAPIAESPRNNDTRHTSKILFRTFIFDALGIHQHEINPAIQ